MAQYYQLNPSLFNMIVRGEEKYTTIGSHQVRETNLLNMQLSYLLCCASYVEETVFRSLCMSKCSSEK